MSHLREDIRRYFNSPPGRWEWWKTVLLTQGIWALVVFRAGSWCSVRGQTRFWPRAFLPFLTVAQKLIEITTGISIQFTTRIGRGLYIGHFGGIIIGPNVVMGEFCNISQGVTIGQGGRGGVQLSPAIGDRVYVGPGAKLFGGITIGSGVAIGANAVVTKDLPDNAVAVGNPARVISLKGSGDFIVQ